MALATSKKRERYDAIVELDKAVDVAVAAGLTADIILSEVKFALEHPEADR